MRINTNVSAIIANHHLNKTDNALTKSMQRLSSGLKINRAEDDSAGIAIASKMHRQIDCIGQTGRNGNDGVSVVQTAEGALNEVESMLQRMRELAVQGANGTNSDDDRKSIEEEVAQLKDEIVRVTEQTQFNNITLLDGSLERRSYCTPVGKGEVISSTDYVPADTYKITVEAAATPAVAALEPAGIGTGAVDEGSKGVIKINGCAVDIEEGDTADVIEAKLVDAATKIGAIYENGAFTTDRYGSDAKIEITFSSLEVSRVFGLNTDAPVQKVGKDAEVKFTDPRAGFQETAEMTVEGNYVTVIDNGGFSMTMKVSDAIDYSFEVTDMGTMPIQIGIAEGQILDIRIQTVSLETLSLTYTNCSTQENCEQAISDMDKAISYISSVRSNLGAYQNRLESAVRSIDVAEESMTAAVSRIEDTDMAEEMTTYTQMNVLSQAGVSVLAQANERPQIVLQLLQ